ncbi:pyridine nucleotide-disulfide oxidoreductase [Helicosporidium sp. ATCC 50920]|nr:pyridine nucleotide-disulfide oxidoreductase [Helicosporidium sp. ATCC 50920]|eukprot:KDD74542.1 pyridine nucleotide-disulfide oxidoreductase [Helicosporidium sp. ATCC 50920]
MVSLDLYMVFRPGAVLRPHLRYSSSRMVLARASSSSSSETYDYDVFCIGAGSGGVRASRMAASRYGAKAGICDLPYAAISGDEAGGAGGTCVLRGCVPKKLFVYASEFPGAMKDAIGFGFGLPDPRSVPLDWPSFLEKKRAELRRLNGVYLGLLRKAGVDYLEGRGRVVGPHSVQVGSGPDSRVVSARHIVVATGGRASVPRFPGSELCATSDHMLEIERVPEKAVVLGAGYIAVEFASVLAGLGCETHLVYRADLPLRGFDADVRRFAAEQLAQAGVVLHPGTVPAGVEGTADGVAKLGRYRVRLQPSGKGQAGGTNAALDAQFVLAAMGRHPNVHNLGLEEAGVKLSPKGAVEVNEYSQTSVPSIWAIGDVTDRMALTPVALAEGMALSASLFGKDGPVAPDHDNVASAVFCQPPISSVGITEEQALERGHGDLDVFLSTFRPMRNTISGNPGRSLMKIIVDAPSDRVLGMHMVGPDAGEIMQGFAVAMKMGVTKKQLDATIGIHPTAAEELVTMRDVSRKIRNGVAV